MVRKAIIGLGIAIPIILVIIFLALPLLRIGVRHFSLNEEIKNFPIQETSITFKTLAFMKTFNYQNAHEGNIFVVINCTVRNIGDTELELVDFIFADTPILKYGEYYTNAKIGRVWYWSFYGIYPIRLMPNQSLSDGYIYFEILEGEQPKDLVFPKKDSPSIIIDLS